MIGYHMYQLIIDTGVVAADKVHYGNMPAKKRDIIMLEERGGTVSRSTCLETALVYIYGKFCSPSDLHQALYLINEQIDQTCITLPNVTDACCKDPAFYNKYTFDARIDTVTSYESLGKNSEELWIAQWVYEVTYSKRLN